MRIDNSTDHPLYRAYRDAERTYRAAFNRHQVVEYANDLETAKAYRRILLLNLDVNAAYIALLESGVPAIEYI